VDFSDFSAAALLLTLSMNISMGFVPCPEADSEQCPANAHWLNSLGRNFGQIVTNSGLLRSRRAPK
jgi:hypothetical protein